MKKKILIVVLEFILFSFYIGICYFNANIIDINKKQYKYFKKEKLVGVDGKINLSNIKSERDELYDDVLALFENDEFDNDLYLSLIEDKKNKNEQVQKDISDLSNKVSDLEKKKTSLNNEYNVLLKKYNDSKKAVSTTSSNKNNSYKIPLINQYPKYPTGCESVALTMLLQYYGVNVTPDNVISKLKKGDCPYYENGIRYGGNPELHFVGNPYSSAGHGVYEKPIAEVANMYKSGINIRNNFPFNDVISIVQKGTPVLVWTSMNLAAPYISKSWIYKPTGEKISWKANEHAVVMVSATNTSVVVADPIGGKLKTFSRSLFEQRYNYYGKKALYY